MTKKPTRYQTVIEAASKGDIEDLKVHIQNGENVDIRYSTGEGNSYVRALQFVVYNGQADVAKVLLEAGADPNAKDHNGDSALRDAITCGHLALVEILLDHGARVNDKLQGGNTPLHYALVAEQNAIAKTLILRGADLDAPNDRGITPRQLASYNVLKQLVPDL